MKKTLVKSIKISFQEKTSKGFVDRSFDTPKEHLEWHLSQMKKSPDARRLGILPLRAALLTEGHQALPCYQGVSFRNI